MAYSASITNRTKNETEDGFVIAHETGFAGREAAWGWVAKEAASRWPDSQVISEIEEYSRTELEREEPAQRGIDFGVPESELEIAVTINDEELFDDPSPWLRKD